MGLQQTNTFSRSTFIILLLKIAKENTLQLPVIEGSAVQSWEILANLLGLRLHSHLVWNKRGLTMPARTLGSWEAMTSVIISGNSTCMASAWMKVLRQYRLIFFTICHTRDISCLFVFYAAAVGSRYDTDVWKSLHRAWHPSVWWGGRIAGSWPPSLSPSCGWLWSAPGCSFVSFLQILPDFWVPREALRTQNTFQTMIFHILFSSTMLFQP